MSLGLEQGGIWLDLMGFCGIGLLVGVLGLWGVGFGGFGNLEQKMGFGGMCREV